MITIIGMVKLKIVIKTIIRRKSSNKNISQEVIIIPN